MKNKRIQKITWNGQTLTIAEWVKKTGITKAAIERRLRSGWSLDDVFTVPCKSFSCQKGDLSMATWRQAWRGLSPEQLETMKEFERIGNTARWE